MFYFHCQSDLGGFREFPSNSIISIQGEIIFPEKILAKTLKVAYRHFDQAALSCVGRRVNIVEQVSRFRRMSCNLIRGKRHTGGDCGGT